MIIISNKNQSQRSTYNFFFSKSRPNLIPYTYQEIMLKNDEMTHDFRSMYITTRFSNKIVKLL